jgi:beta-glucan synthesis-associated protein KRE6
VGQLVEKHRDPCAEDPMCISVNEPLLKNVRRGLIDPATPQSAMKKKSADGSEWQLVVRLLVFILYLDTI